MCYDQIIDVKVIVNLEALLNCSYDMRTTSGLIFAFLYMISRTFFTGIVFSGYIT
jgi:hypothetical protein